MGYQHSLKYPGDKCLTNTGGDKLLWVLCHFSYGNYSSCCDFPAMLVHYGTLTSALNEMISTTIVQSLVRSEDSPSMTLP